MAALLEVVLEHFKLEGTPESDARPAEAAAGQVTPSKAAAGDDTGEKAGTDDPGRVIIFTNRRDSVQSIVEMLRAHEPLITARYGPCTFLAACHSNAVAFVCFHGTITQTWTQEAVGPTRQVCRHTVNKLFVIDVVTNAVCGRCK